MWQCVLWNMLLADLLINMARLEAQDVEFHAIVKKFGYKVGPQGLTLRFEGL